MWVEADASETVNGSLAASGCSADRGAVWGGAALLKWCPCIMATCCVREGVNERGRKGECLAVGLGLGGERRLI